MISFVVHSKHTRRLIKKCGARFRFSPFCYCCFQTPPRPHKSSRHLFSIRFDWLGVILAERLVGKFVVVGKRFTNGACVDTGARMETMTGCHARSIVVRVPGLTLIEFVHTRLSLGAGERPKAGLGHPINMLRCGPSKRPLVHGAAFR